MKSEKGSRWIVAGLVLALLVLHQDLWFWRDARLFLGLPIGLSYHVLYCVAVALVMALAVRWAWPRELQESAARERD